MIQYSIEFKLKVVKYCLKNYHSYGKTAKHFNIKDKRSVSTWVKKYQEHGIQGLEKNKEKYNGKFKQDVVEYMHNNHLSLRQTAIKFNLGHHSVVNKWEHIYYEKGPQALYEENCGKRKMSSKIQKNKVEKKSEEDLLAENQRLRMENAYLKKLQALVQERTKPKQSKK